MTEDRCPMMLRNIHTAVSEINLISLFLPFKRNDDFAKPLIINRFSQLKTEKNELEKNRKRHIKYSVSL